MLNSECFANFDLIRILRLFAPFYWKISIWRLSVSYYSPIILPCISVYIHIKRSNIINYRVQRRRRQATTNNTTLTFSIYLSSFEIHDLLRYNRWKYVCEQRTIRSVKFRNIIVSWLPTTPIQADRYSIWTRNGCNEGCVILLNEELAERFDAVRVHYKWW